MMRSLCQEIPEEGSQEGSALAEAGSLFWGV